MFTYLLIRLIGFPISLLPYSWIQILGKGIGSLLFYLLPRFRKKALSNLALAKALTITEKEKYKIAKESFQNLAIISLEFPKLASEKKLPCTIYCENPKVAQELHDQGTGIVFFCGHLSNWETLFLDGTSRMKGIAIGKPIKNKKLYHWIVSIREKFGGKIIAQKDAVKEGLRALKKGIFVGIVGDQAMPSSGYSYPFLGRRAWTTTAPALLAYRTNCPIIVPIPKRTPDGYQIVYSDPIWPNLNEPMEKEVIRMMDQSLFLLEEKIKESPGEWLWQHNRWKQQTPKNIYKRFRHDSICIILPPTTEPYSPHLKTFREIYPLDFIQLIAPLFFKDTSFDADELFFYSDISEVHQYDFRPKLVFDFSNLPNTKKHYKRLSAFEVLDLSDLKKLAAPHFKRETENDLSLILKRALCRPSVWNKDAH